MIEWVTIGDCRLACGDALDVLQTLDSESVDSVVTDPPYCSGGFSEASRKQSKSQGLRSATTGAEDFEWFVNDNMGAAALSWMLRQVSGQCYFLMPNGGSLLVFTDWRMLSYLPAAMESGGLRHQNTLVWDKGNPGLGCGFRPQHEMILHFVKDRGAYHDNTVGNVLRFPRVHSTQKDHQTQKPVELIERLIGAVSPRGATILDPFMGSGTTGVACVKMGRAFIGVEREPRYFDIACKRIREVYDDFALFPSTAAESPAAER